MLPARFDDVQGKRVRYFRAGEGPTIVFLHGYPDNLQMWSEVAPLLPDFDVLALDWPGMGGSEAWPGGATPFHMAGRLVALLDHWRIERAAIVGIDMGGQPALVTAARNRERVSHVVVSGSLLQWDAPTSLEIAMLRRFRFNQFSLKHFPRLVFQRAVSTSLRAHLPSEVRNDFWEHFRRRAVRDFIVRMCAGYQGTLPRLPEEYARVSVPTLCLWGTNDRHFAVTHAERLQQQIRGAKAQLIGEGEHWLPLQMPREFAAAIRAFVR